jgi:hypothetical protein
MAVSALAVAEKKLRTHALSFKLGEAAEEVLNLPFKEADRPSARVTPLSPGRSMR